jgi:hypothetical protein
LVLEEIGGFEHCDHHNKSPAHRGFHELKTRQLGICSEESKEEAAQTTVPAGIEIPA